MVQCDVGGDDGGHQIRFDYNDMTFFDTICEWFVHTKWNETLQLKTTIMTNVEGDMTKVKRAPSWWFCRRYTPFFVFEYKHGGRMINLFFIFVFCLVLYWIQFFSLFMEKQRKKEKQVFCVFFFLTNGTRSDLNDYDDYIWMILSMKKKKYSTRIIPETFERKNGDI